MPRSTARTAAFLLAMLLGSGAVAQVRVQVSADQIADDDDLQVTFIFSGRQGEPQLPDLGRDWRIAGQQRGSSTQIDWSRGIQETQTTWALSLVPKRTGQLVIGPAKLLDRSGNVVAQSEPVTILVQGVEPVKPSVGAREENIPQGRVMLIPELPRDVYYAGEPFVVSFTLYIDHNIRTRGDIFKPELGELTTPEAIQRKDVLGELRWEGAPRTVHGRSYSRLPVFREVWTVLRPDRVTIPALKARVGTSIGNFVPKSPPLELEIRGVPEVGRPPGYREGAIGQFALQAEVKADPKQAWAVLEVTVSGSGGLERLEAPPLSGVTGAKVEALESDEKLDEIRVDEAGVNGKRVFQYLLTPERAGTVFVPALELCYFDPVKGRFEVARSKPVHFQSAQKSSASGPIAAAASGKHEAEIRPIVDRSDLIGAARKPLNREPWFLIALAVPVLAFVTVELGRWAALRRRAGSGKTRARRAHSVATRRLRGAAGGSPDEYYSELARALRDYVLDRHGILLAGMTNDGMRQALFEVGYPPAISERLIAELENCDFARFAPGAGEATERRTAEQRTRALLDDMEKVPRNA